ncbi:MAG: hypothetical protein M3Q36_03780 [bacterium]|nr:hypothetical protein [bacterium]
MNKYIRSVGVIVILFAFVISQLGQLQAQSNALAISPRKDYTLEAGKSVTDTLTLTNRDTQLPLQIALDVIDFTFENETGTPQLLTESNESTNWSLKDFVTLPEQVTVDPGQTIRIPIKVEAPNGIGAGSYYSAIQYSAVNSADEDRLNISASGVTLMFVKVPGLASEQLSFLQFGTFVPDEAGTGGSFAGIFFGERPKVMAYRLKNDGNIAEQPNASIVVKNSGGEVIYTIEDANPKDQIALRGQTRRFDACIVPETEEQTTDNGVEINAVVCGDTNFKPGRYTAELTVLYGENGNETREITAKTTFWYLPWWFIGVSTVGLALIVAGGFYIWRRVQGLKSRKTRRR